MALKLKAIEDEIYNDHDQRYLARARNNIIDPKSLPKPRKLPKSKPDVGEIILDPFNDEYSASEGAIISVEDKIDKDGKLNRKKDAYHDVFNRDKGSVLYSGPLKRLAFFTGGFTANDLVMHTSNMIKRDKHSKTKNQQSNIKDFSSLRVFETDESGNLISTLVKPFNPEEFINLRYHYKVPTQFHELVENCDHLFAKALEAYTQKQYTKAITMMIDTLKRLKNLQAIDVKHQSIYEYNRLVIARSINYITEEAFKIKRQNHSAAMLRAEPLDSEIIEDFQFNSTHMTIKEHLYAREAFPELAEQIIVETRLEDLLKFARQIAQKIKKKNNKEGKDYNEDPEYKEWRKLINDITIKIKNKALHAKNIGSSEEQEEAKNYYNLHNFFSANILLNLRNQQLDNYAPKFAAALSSEGISNDAQLALSHDGINNNNNDKKPQQDLDQNELIEELTLSKQDTVKEKLIQFIGTQKQVVEKQNDKLNLYTPKPLRT